MKSEAQTWTPPIDPCELTLLIADRANLLALRRTVEPGGELALWLEAEAQVKRDLAQPER